MAIARPSGDFDKSYQQDMSIIRQRWQFVLLALFILTAASTPFWAPAYVVITINRIGIALIAVQGLNILTGYAGQISMGQAAFMLTGGYISVLTVTYWGIPVLLAMPFAALGTGIFGLFFGLPSLRVKGFYLTMATLAAQFIIPWMTRYTFTDYLGGSEGMILASVPKIGSFEFSDPSSFIFITITAVIITSVISVNISRSRLGRAFVAIRDNDLAAELLGVNLFGYKLRAFFLAAVFAGLAGALSAHSQRAVGTELGYTLNESIIFLGMLVVGGLGTNLGPFLGVTFIILIQDASNEIGKWLAAARPEMTAQLLTSFRPIFFGLLLMLFLIFEPRGMAHRWQLLKAAWRLRPFSH